MPFVRLKTGEVRLIWRVLIIIVLFVAVAILLRFIPISLYSWFLASSGVARQDAVATAKAIVFEDPIWSTVLSILNGLMSLPLVWFLIGVVEGRNFAWKDVGLDWRRGSLSSLALGALVALVIYAANVGVGHALGSSIPAVSAFLAS